MFCASCGGEIGVDASFCGGCGVAQGRGPILLPRTRPYPTPIAPEPPSRPPPLVFTANLSHQHPRKEPESNSAGVAAWILLVFACAGALIPGIGFAMWLIIGPILLITLVLGVVTISKGRTISGVLVILMSLVVVPLFVIAAPFVATAIAVGTVAATASELSPTDGFGDAESSIPVGGVLSMPFPEAATPEVALQVASLPVDAPAQNQPQARQAPVASEVPRNWPDVEDSAPTPRSPEMPTVRVSNAVNYAVLRTQPTVFSRGLGRLTPGTLVTLGASVADTDWVEASTTDGRRGFLSRRELDEP